MISFSSILIDSEGTVTFYELPQSILNDTTRRVSRTKTLDGGCVLVDGGFSSSDITFDIDIKYELDLFNSIKYLHQNKTLLYIVVNENFYSGVISAVKLDNSELETIRLTLLVKEQLNE